MSWQKPYKPDDPTLLANYFDPHNQRHCDAYRLLHDVNGYWPEWFLQELRDNGVTVHDGWDTVISRKIVDAWIKQKLDHE